MKHINVLWSGGLDSTYLINYYLEKGYHVHAFYVEISEQKSKRELKAIDKCLSYFKPYAFTFEGTIFKLEIYQSCEPNLPQPLIWSLALQFIGNKYQDVAIGYVCNDTAISWIDEIEELCEAMNKFSCVDRRLHFPLTKMSKFEIIRQTPLEVLPHMTWCERHDSKSKPCCKCEPCKKYLGLGYFKKGQTKLTFPKGDKL